jgi:chemotaxis protein histidine kinase CheA
VTPAEIEAQLRQLRVGYARQLPDKVAAFETAFEAFAAAPWTEDAHRTAYRMIHSLAGSSGTYGFDTLCRLCRSAEAVVKEALEQKRPLQDVELDRLRALLADLRTQAAQAATNL